jgi:hypothetical protein
MTARPSTPYPHTHSLNHTSSGSYFHAFSSPASYTTQPIHFSLRALPSPTPPSLLRRTASGKSKNAPSSPKQLDRRESTSSCSSSSSGPSPKMPTTPIYEGEETAEQCTPLELPPRLVESPDYKRTGFSLPPPEYNWTPKQSLDLLPSSSPDSYTPRPKLRRQDTPTVSTTTTSWPKQRYTSVMDGGRWIVVE